MLPLTWLPITVSDLLRHYRKTAGNGLLFFLVLFHTLLFSSCSRAAPPDSVKRVSLGSEQAWSGGRLSGSSYLLLTNRPSQTSFNLADSLISAKKLIRIFSPEHGFDTRLPDGVLSETEPVYNGIPVVSLYGKKKRPDRTDFAGGDTLLIDLQDAGLRFYTYLTTAVYCAEEAAAAGIPVILLDRPDPLGGEVTEGPILQNEFRSFVGCLPVPVRYGMTLGELLTLAKGENWLKNSRLLDLSVIRVAGWRRSFLWPDTNLEWVPPSPNLPDFQTLQLYSGTCLFEGTAISEGRGTQTPFLWIGAPWFSSEKSDTLLMWGIRAVREDRLIRELPGRAVNPKYKNQKISGYRLSVIAGQEASPLQWSLSIIREELEKNPERLALRDHFWLLWGNRSLTETPEMKQESDRFRETRKRYLLY